jgi:hypothetical protein
LVIRVSVKALLDIQVILNARAAAAGIAASASS